MSKKVLLTILDGWGLGKTDKFNAIDNAQTPNFDKLKTNYFFKELYTFGEHVGLPNDNFGTSETNHLAIGTGQITLQPLLEINQSIQDKTFFANQRIIDIVNRCNQNESNIHLAGILSDGGVHSHINHLFAILETLRVNNFGQIAYIHVFTDGRDTPPVSAKTYLEKLQNYADRYSFVKIATLQGRYYLDRDKDYAKTKNAYDLIFNNQGTYLNNWQMALDYSYEVIKDNLNDQYHAQYKFIRDIDITNLDAFILFNFRADRIVQLLEYIEQNSPEVFTATMYSPDSRLKTLSIFDRDSKLISLADILSSNGKIQSHIAETEKYAHVTYYFDGRNEQPNTNETWQLIESNKTVKPFYNFEPSMRAFDVTKEILARLEDDTDDFIMVNFAETDMVGHTGRYEAALIAAEATDYCLGLIYERIKDKLDTWTWIITADHGNSEEMWDYKNNQPHTQHTFNNSPLIIISTDTEGVPKSDEIGELTQIAPTILKLMLIDIPKEMKYNPFI